jgi:hypothetical protein
LLRFGGKCEEFGTFCFVDRFGFRLRRQGFQPVLFGGRKFLLHLRQQIGRCLLGALQVPYPRRYHAEFSRRQPLDCAQQIAESDLNRHLDDAH